MARTAVNNRGQAFLSEHVVTFFIVIAAVTAMTIFIQRSIQGKIKDSRDYMVGLAAGQCDADCQAASGGITREYEPYYANAASAVIRNSEHKIGLVGGTEIVNGQRRLFSAQIAANEAAETFSDSQQLPPKDAK